MSRDGSSGAGATRRRILVERRAVGGAERRGEILETLGDAPHTRYRVRWEDGRESIVYPGSDARIEGREGATRSRTRTRATTTTSSGRARTKPEVAPPRLRAAAGDRLVIRAHQLGEHPRDAEIIDVLGPEDAPRFRVRWDDTGEESILFPGADAFVEHYEHGRTRRPKRRAEAGR